MNIFFLDKDPKLAAQYHNDSHCVKMILESAQLLSTAHQVIDGVNSNLYKLTHKNHPCSNWCRQSKKNYLWLYNLFVELSNEYTFRYNKIHKSYLKLNEYLKVIPANLNSDEFTQPSQAMPDQYRDSCAVTAYRNYYKNDKLHLAKWTNRTTPFWF